MFDNIHIIFSTFFLEIVPKLSLILYVRRIVFLVERHFIANNNMYVKNTRISMVKHYSKNNKAIVSLGVPELGNFGHQNAKNPHP